MNISDDAILQEGNARWLRHTVEVGRGTTQHVQAPDVLKRTGKARWSTALIGALIALVVVAALCADLFVVAG